MLGIIFGTSISSILNAGELGEPIETPFGKTSSDISESKLFGPEVCVLARHGKDGATYAHKVNYRANLWALRERGVRQVIATATVGRIHSQFEVGDIVLPDQVIDYTYGRDHTYFGVLPITHFDFTHPFTERIRQGLIESRPGENNRKVLNCGTYGCTQGPRLETRAEIARLRNDGCDLVGMTLMPEASLARELNLEYAALCLVVNVAAGLTTNEIDLKQAHEVATTSIEVVRAHLRQVIQLLN